MNSLLSTDDSIDWNSFTPEGIELSAEEIDRAVQLSQLATHPTIQWQVYLNALVLYGFENWINEWAPELAINYSQSTLYQVNDTNLIEAVCNVFVGSFQLCLIVTTDRFQSIIDCSNKILQSPEFIPDYYVLVEVLEEEMQVQVYGYQRRDKLLQKIPTDASAVTTNLFYPLPLNQFELEPSSLLLELRCLEPEVMPRSTIALPNLHALTPSPSSPTPHSPLPTFPPINVASWLRDHLDTLAQELSWVLMPALTSTVAELRSNDPFSTIQSALAARGITIPPEARGAYQDVALDPMPLRLYAVTWAPLVTAEIPEWALLLVLGTVSGEYLPLNTSLQVQVAGELLDSQTAETTVPYLYTQVIGNVNEQIWSSIRLPQGELVELPPFTFNLE